MFAQFSDIIQPSNRNTVLRYITDKIPRDASYDLYVITTFALLILQVWVFTEPK